MSTPGNSKRCTAKRAISSSVRRRRIGTLSKLRRELHQLAGFVEVVGRQHADLDEPLERRVDVGHALAHQFELEGRAVLGEHLRRCDRG